MRNILLASLFFAFTISAFGQKEYDSTYGKPLIVLIETNPWLMVIGSDVPSFTLYEKGQVIYKRVENKTTKFYEAKLYEREIPEVINSLVASEDIYQAPEVIMASSATDQPDNILYLNYSKPKTIRVYGDLRVGSKDRTDVPKDFLIVFDNIKKYTNDSAGEWLPKKIEVMMWDYDYAPNKRPWPGSFPDLKNPATIKFDNNSFSLFIDQKDFPEFKKYYNSMGEKEAVEINGRKMAISYRLPFPNLN